MEQPKYLLSAGTRIKTHPSVNNTQGLHVKQSHLDARRPNAVGTIVGVVGGHSGDVYWVKHEGMEAHAVYCFTEFELIQPDKSKEEPPQIPSMFLYEETARRLHTLHDLMKEKSDIFPKLMVETVGLGASMLDHAAVQAGTVVQLEDLIGKYKGLVEDYRKMVDEMQARLDKEDE